MTGRTRAAAAALLLAMAAMPAAAQSGRRPKGRTVTPEMAPLPTETAPPPEPVRDERDAIKLAALTYSSEAFDLDPTAKYLIFEMTKVLRANGNFIVTASDAKGNRKAAIDVAKAARTEYVFFLEIEYDDVGNESASSSYGFPLWVDYYVYEPATAKSALHGRLRVVSGGTVARGGSGIPRFPGDGRPGGVLMIPEAGDLMARRIMKMFAERPTIPSGGRPRGR